MYLILSVDLLLATVVAHNENRGIRDGQGNGNGGICTVRHFTMAPFHMDMAWES